VSQNTHTHTHTQTYVPAATTTFCIYELCLNKITSIQRTGSNPSGLSFYKAT